MYKEINYTLYDNFKNKLKNFDMVVVSHDNKGLISCNIGILYGIKVITYKNFPDTDSEIIIKKQKLFNIDDITVRVNENMIENCEMPGEYIIRSIIKIDNMTEDLVFLRQNLIHKLKLKEYTGELADTNRVYIHQLLKDREKENF